MKLSGADIIVRTLIEQGVDTVFGYPGGQILNVYDSLYKYQDEIEEYKKRIAEATSFDGKKYAYTLPEAVKEIDNLATKLYNSEKQNKMHEEDIKYYVGLIRRLKKLLNENNIEYEEMIKDYDALTFHKDNEE